MKLTPTYPVPGPCTTWSAMRPIPVSAITWIDRATQLASPVRLRLCRKALLRGCVNGGGLFRLAGSDSMMGAGAWDELAMLRMGALSSAESASVGRAH